ncbi:MAG TPA: hypothetical protein VII11_07300 [Bacteroidota bacterium]
MVKTILFVDANAEMAGSTYCMLDLIDHLDPKRYRLIVLRNPERMGLRLRDSVQAVR